MKGHTIIKRVFTQFPGLPHKMFKLFGKSEVWWRSHGYELRTDNPLANGNLSPVDHLLRFLDLYEAADHGAGKYLAEELAAELRARFDAEPGEICDREMKSALITEFCEAMVELEKSDLKDKSEIELVKTDAELSHIGAKVDLARARTRAEIKRREARSVTHAKFGRNGNG